MDTQTTVPPAQNAPKGYVTLPPEIDEPSEQLFSAKFIIFSILVISMATAAGLLKSGRVSLNQYFSPPKTVATVLAHTPFVPKATPAPVPALKPDTFVVTSISVGQPSFAIINGNSRAVGDAVNAPGVTGWKVRQITSDAVVFQNGSTAASVPLTAPGLKPLDDTLHPLN